MSNAELRTTLRKMSDRARIALEVLQRYEQASIELTVDFIRALELQPITFLVFACLGTKRGMEEIKLDLFETVFFKLRRFHQRTKELINELAAAGISVELLVIVPDLEPIRTWGWEVTPEEMSGLCEMMIEEGRSKLPRGWNARSWSALERQANAVDDYAKMVAWAEHEAPPLIVREETAFFREIGRRYPDIVTKRHPSDLARRQIAAYAHEGRVLEQLFPQGILLMNAIHSGREDKMYALRRTTQPLIAHPFTD